MDSNRFRAKAVGLGEFVSLMGPGCLSSLLLWTASGAGKHELELQRPRSLCVRHAAHGGLFILRAWLATKVDGTCFGCSVLILLDFGTSLGAYSSEAPDGCGDS